MKSSRRWPVALGSALLILTGILPSATSARGISSAQVGMAHTSASATTASYDDQFSSSTLNPKWHWVREHPGYWSLTAHPGYLRIITEDVGVPSSAPILLENAPTGNIEISTHLSMTPTQNWQQGGLIMYGDDNNYVRLTNDEDTIELGSEVNGVYNAQQLPLPQAPDYFLQLDKHGSAYTGYASTDGMTWKVVGTYVESTLNPTQIGLLAFNGNGSTATQIPADFDFFQERALTTGAPGPLQASPDAPQSSPGKAPGGPLIVTLPGKNALLTGSFLPFAWNPDPKATYYDLQIWLVQAIPAQPITSSAITTFTARLTGSSYKLSVKGMPKGIYHWRMAATDASGALSSPWTAEQVVTIQ